MRILNRFCVIALLVSSSAWAKQNEPAPVEPLPETPMPPPPPAVEPLPPPPLDTTAQPPAPAESCSGCCCYWAKTAFSGTIDFYGMWNFNSPANGVNGLRSFDVFNAGGLQLNLAKLTIARAAEPIGYRMDIGFGLVYDSPLGLGPADPSTLVNPTHAAWHKHFQQAYLSFKIPVGKGITIDGGKFVTHMGNEVIESRDNWNYSRGLLFNFAIPLFHTGLRALIPLTDQLNLGLYWLNGWNSFVEEGSKMQTGGLQVSYAPTASTQVLFNFIGGKSGLVFGGKPGSDSTNRYVFDLIGIYKPTDQLGLALNFDYGYDDAGSGVKYWAIAAYGRYQFAPWYASALRFEYFHDMDKAFIGSAAEKVWEITATLAELSHTFGPANMMWRIEFRHDQADQAIFLKEQNGMEKFQDTITVGTIAYFQ